MYNILIFVEYKVFFPNLYTILYNSLPHNCPMCFILLNTDLSGKVSDTDPRLSDSRTPKDHTHDGRYYTKQQVDDKTLLKTYDLQHGLDFGIEGYSTFLVPKTRIDMVADIPLIPNTGTYRILGVDPIISGTQWQLRVIFWVNGQAIYKVCDLK